MNIEKSYLTNNNCYKAGEKIVPKGILVHSVGTGQPNRQVFVRNWNVPKPGGKQVCVHAFLDDNGVTQTLPWTTRCWGCGSGSKGSYNNSHIQFEMCEPAGTKYSGGTITSYNTDKNKDFFDKSYKNAVDLCIYLCKEYGLTEKNIVCHSEAHKLGYASNHSDVMHWFTKHGKSMDTFREDVKKGLSAEDTSNDNTSVETVNTGVKVGDKVKLKAGAKQYNDKAIRSDYMDKEYTVKEIKGDRVVLTIDNTVIYAVKVSDLESTSEFSSYKVRVTTTALNYRVGPGLTYKVAGTIRDQGIYTIVAEQNGWGKLKSGAGWISLAYTKKV